MFSFAFFGSNIKYSQSHHGPNFREPMEILYKKRDFNILPGCIKHVTRESYKLFAVSTTTVSMIVVVQLLFLQLVHAGDNIVTFM